MSPTATLETRKISAPLMDQSCILWLSSLATILTYLCNSSKFLHTHHTHGRSGRITLYIRNLCNRWSEQSASQTKETAPGTQCVTDKARCTASLDTSEKRDLFLLMGSITVPWLSSPQPSPYSLLPLHSFTDVLSIRKESVTSNTNGNTQTKQMYDFVN